MDNYDWIPKERPRFYALHRLAQSFDTKVALISMICSLKKAFQNANKDVTFIDLINKLTDISTDEMKQELADICEAFYSDPWVFSNCGFKSAKEIKSEVQRILESELPF